ncbi:hypothetical protein [Bacillus daqingensis]
MPLTTNTNSRQAAAEEPLLPVFLCGGMFQVILAEGKENCQESA